LPQRRTDTEVHCWQTARQTQIPVATNKQSNTRTFEDDDLYSVRLEVSTVQDKSIESQSVIGIRKRVQCSAVECNQRTAEAEEVTDP
jgi:hypothetical protein